MIYKIDIFRNFFSLPLDMDSIGSSRALILLCPPKLSVMAGSLWNETGGFRRSLILVMIILLYFYLLQPCSIYCGEASVLQSEYFKFERSRSSCFLCFNPFKMFFKDDQEEEVIKYYCNESYVEDFTNKLRSSLKSLAKVNVSNPTLKKNLLF